MQKKRLSVQRETRVAAFVFLAPAFVFLGVYIAYSLFDVFRLSLYDWNGIDPVKTYVGFANWKELLSDAAFLGAVKHNLFILVASLIVQLPMGIGIAFMLDRLGRRAGPLKVAYYLPSLFSTAAVGILFLFIYNPRNGIVTSISRLFGGGTVDLLGSAKYSLVTVFTVICWTAIPFYMVFFLSALANQPYEIYEAAVIDGVSVWQHFFRILLPMLYPSFRTAATLSIIASLKYFDLIYIITEGGPNNSSELMATYMYRMTFRFRRMGYGSAIASGMFIVVTVFSLGFLWLANRRREED